MNDDSIRSAPPPFTGLVAAFWMSTAFLWMVLAGAALAALREEALRDMVSLGALSAATFLLTAALLTGRYPAGPDLKAALGLRRTEPLLLPLGLLGGVACQIPSEGLLTLMYQLFPGSEKAALERLGLMTPHGMGHAVALMFVLALLVPFAEEAFFRGAVFGALRRSGRTGVRAATITGIGFTMSHFDPTMLAPIGLVAVYLSFLRAASGSLWPGVLAHVGFNSLTMLGVVGGIKVPEGSLLTWQGQVAGSLTLAAAVAAFWLLAARSSRARQSRDDEGRVVDG